MWEREREGEGEEKGEGGRSKDGGHVSGGGNLDSRFKRGIGIFTILSTRLEVGPSDVSIHS